MAAATERPGPARSGVKALAYLNGNLVFEADVAASFDRRIPPEFPDRLTVVFLDHDTYGTPIVLASASSAVDIRG